MYEDDIPNELVLGEVYTGEQLWYFLSENRNSVIVTDGMLLRNTNYSLASKRASYINKAENGDFQIPASANMIYEMSKC